MITGIWIILFLILWFSIEDFWESFIGSFIITAIIYGLLEFIKEFINSDAGQLFFVFITIVACLVLYFTYKSRKKAAEKAAEIAKIEQELISTVKHFTRSEKIKNYQQTKEKGWIRTEGKVTREEVENDLKLQAAKMGCNSVIKFTFHSEKVSYQAGKGPKGNPYYKNKTVFSGEAVAVQLEKVIKKIPTSKPTFEKYEGKILIIDGNNILGRSEWKFNPLKALLVQLKIAGYNFTVFFDNNIYRALKENELISDTETIEECLSKVINQDKKDIRVTPAGEQADSFILEFAKQQNSAIISNDKFTDFEPHYPKVINERLLKFDVVNDTVLVPKLSII